MHADTNVFVVTQCSSPPPATTPAFRNNFILFPNFVYIAGINLYSRKKIFWNKFRINLYIRFTDQKKAPHHATSPRKIVAADLVTNSRWLAKPLLPAASSSRPLSAGRGHPVPAPRSAARGHCPLAEATPRRLLAAPGRHSSRTRTRGQRPRASPSSLPATGAVLLLAPTPARGWSRRPPGSPPLRPEATQVAGSGSGVAPAHREALARHPATPPQIRRSTTSAERARRRQTPATAVWPHRAVCGRAPTLAQAGLARAPTPATKGASRDEGQGGAEAETEAANHHYCRLHQERGKEEGASTFCRPTL